MELSTEKLRIVQLDREQFSLLIEGLDKLEENLGLEISNEKLQNETKAAMKWLYSQACAFPDKFQWFTAWTLVLKSANICVGNASFLGGPDASGQAELTLGIHEYYTASGFTGEAAAALADWAFGSGVKSVVMEVLNEDLFTGSELEKAGFQKVHSSDISSFWRKRGN